MNIALAVILIHQLLFQSMFISKNILLRRKSRQPISGRNREAMVAIAFFMVFILAAVALASVESPIGRMAILPESVSLAAGVVLLVANLAVAAASLLAMRDSWRVGVLEDQKTELITAGVYRLTRNPYFIAYLFMFAAYTLILQNAILLGLSLIGFGFVHNMIRKEENYLRAVHGSRYLRYLQNVPRYLIR